MARKFIARTAYASKSRRSWNYTATIPRTIPYIYYRSIWVGQPTLQTFFHD